MHIMYVNDISPSQISHSYVSCSLVIAFSQKSKENVHAAPLYFIHENLGLTKVMYLRFMVLYCFRT